MSKEFNEEVDIGEDCRSKCELPSEWTPSAHELFPSRRKFIGLSLWCILLGSWKPFLEKGFIL